MLFITKHNPPVQPDRWLFHTRIFMNILLLRNKATPPVFSSWISREAGHPGSKKKDTHGPSATPTARLGMGNLLNLVKPIRRSFSPHSPKSKMPQPSKVPALMAAGASSLALYFSVRLPPLWTLAECPALFGPMKLSSYVSQLIQYKSLVWHTQSNMWWMLYPVSGRLLSFFIEKICLVNCW